MLHLNSRQNLAIFEIDKNVSIPCVCYCSINLTYAHEQLFQFEINISVLLQTYCTIDEIFTLLFNIMNN